MHIVAAAWIFVALMMALAEATATEGSVLGALFTFLLYGVMPLAILLYVMGAPMRRRARRLAEQQQWEAEHAAQPGPAGNPTVNPSLNDSAAPAPD
ncbi:MAG TPA: hypothetical protein VLA61_25270 [Ideonella sp.]|uniref:hypothetical protein n=1 Tax=Ideonella sp. TaxID=1929293 RepID=UPI002BFD3F8E|nr:hypothetical protein [Ideonella sp.]HSI51594.1 hypothetical protein [Ideonella sp.]